VCLWSKRAACHVSGCVASATTFLALFVSLWLSLPAHANDFSPRVIFDASRSVVRIEAARPRLGVQVGTGVVLAQDKVVTACHVLRDATNVSVIHGGIRYVVSALQALPEKDVCALSVQGLNAVPAKSRAAAQLQIGEPVVAVGFSGGGPMRWGRGEIARTHYFQGGLVLQTSASFTSGASGGPLLDSQGRVVGLLTFRMLDRGPQFYSVPVEWAVDAVELATTDGVNTAFDELPFWQRDENELPFFMRAGSLETEHRWSELRALSKAWRRADPRSAEPSFIESALEERVGHYEAARSKLEQAVFRNPRHALAWSALVRVRLHFEDLGGARDAYTHLTSLSMVLADRLLAEHQALGF